MKKMGSFLGLWLIFSVSAFAQYITITSPNGGEKWSRRKVHSVTWTYSKIPDNTLVKLVLFKDGNKIGNIVENVGIGHRVFNWRVGIFDGGIADCGEGYIIRIRDMNGQYPFDETNLPFSIWSEAGANPDFEAKDIFWENGILKIRISNNSTSFHGNLLIYNNMGGVYSPQYKTFQGVTLPEGDTVLDWGDFYWPESECSLFFDVNIDPNNDLREMGTLADNKLKKEIYRMNAFHLIEFPFKLGLGQSQISVKKDEQVNFFSRENFSSSELHRDTSQFEIRFPVTVGIRNCGGKPTTQRVDLFVYGSSPSMNTDWPGENRTGIVLQPGETRNYTLTVVAKMPWIPNKMMFGHFQVILIENDGGHERKVISAHPVVVAGQLAQ